MEEVQKIIKESVVRQEKIRDMIRGGDMRWVQEVERLGLVMPYGKMSEERKRNVEEERKRREKIHSVIKEYEIKFKPCVWRLIIDVSNREDRREREMYVRSIVEMMYMYIPVHEIYQYQNYGKGRILGYRKYGGERVIVYMHRKEQTGEKKQKEWNREYNKKKLKEYDISECYKVIITDDEEFDIEGWTRKRVIKEGDIKKNVISIWTGWREMRKLREYCEKNRVILWPGEKRRDSEIREEAERRIKVIETSKRIGVDRKVIEKIYGLEK